MMRRVIAILIAMVLILGVTVPAMAVGLDDKKEELEDVEQDMLSTQDALEDVELKQQDVSIQLEKLDKQLEQKQAELDKANADLDETKKQLEETEKALEQAIKEAEYQQQLLDSRVRAMYMNDQSSILEMILSAQSVSDLIMRVEMAAKITQCDNDLLTQMCKLQDDIAKKKQAIEEQKLHIEQQKQLIVEEKKGIETKRAEKNKLLADLEQQKESYEKALNEMEAQSKELEAVIRKLQAEEEARRKAQAQKNSGSSSRGGSVVATGRFTWPVPGYSRISSSFGYRVHPVLGVGKLHTGTDIAAPSGANVVAADGGMVIQSGWLGAYGKAVIIDHGNGISTLYGHNSSLLVSIGQEVSQGQVIARVGMTGLATGPHSHFEVRINGTPTNPMQYFK
ncbi:murein hydrolase activator EnvC family protein [Mahella australiensis]|uniref:Peptidase M23 n=1 Tax=Mahella australiensis (strain DSM 15567 / CIP 107919 / 50-1 BON) TaxID=697281 RepID=F4A0I3_MAHA5|nr:peptidoglycan DD-metalloendopeptidase family protein [Mahella australiensis]AEE95862.1 Peptidase M23 [Mahella australiensis 50-1 BON]